MVAAALGGINLLGYIRCEKNHKAHIKGFLIGQARKNISAEQMANIGSAVAAEAMKK